MTDIPTVVNELGSFADHKEVGDVLQGYLDAARAGDVALMRGAFRDSARICGTYGGKLVDWSLDEFCAVIATGGPAPMLSAMIVGIDICGTAGNVRVEITNWRGTRYSDFFVLLRVDVGWRIASKVFFAHSRA
jgi:hypothetical protein